ncbi:MFS transporter, BCD family, chlorophyll transporter [Rhizobium sp. RU20A]|uniref:BCD family MFS transporter n=1 Tax=Rhizobium sp. RU20A TaxID=1907412 RepID=UPI000955444D|nr:BCD family MFS transporter [Rhizobium sp. RU20A]SIR43684.1 MFS transporter, BCD family, chlorophyll transporter [Rhizobium sp. RU20A]
MSGRRAWFSGRARSEGLGWLAIARLGLVQAALGAIVVLTNSTLNRVMVVELGLAAVIPGLLVGLHYGVQITRPLWGHRSDAGASRTRFILAGLALLAAAGTLASATTFLFERDMRLGLLVAVIAYGLIGIGIGASGTSLLALIATRTAPGRRASAATITWMMMIFGIIVTSIVTGAALDPYSHARLVIITALTGAVVFAVACLALVGIERGTAPLTDGKPEQPAIAFRDSLRDVWQDREARLFTLFIFLSMLAYSTQDLILEPFAGLLFAMTPGQTTTLSGTQHAGVFLGMAAVGIGGWLAGRRAPALARVFIVAGCLGSAGALALLVMAAAAAPHWPLEGTVFALGLANGLFAVAAIGTMMGLAADGRTQNAGLRMGVWGAAQAIAFGLGGLTGSLVVDLGRRFTASDREAFMIVFALEATLFLASSLVALRLGRRKPSPMATLSQHPLAAE